MTPESAAQARAVRSGYRRERIDEFAMVLATRTKPNGNPVSIGDAAKAVGVTRRTGDRYIRELRDQGRAPR